MDLAARLEPLRADVVPLGGGEVAVAKERRGEAGIVGGAVGEAGGGAGAEAVRVDLHAEQALGDQDDAAIDRMRRQRPPSKPSQRRWQPSAGPKLGRTRSR